MTFHASRLVSVSALALALALGSCGSSSKSDPGTGGGGAPATGMTGGQGGAKPTSTTGSGGAGQNTSGNGGSTGNGGSAQPGAGGARPGVGGMAAGAGGMAAGGASGMAGASGMGGARPPLGTPDMGRAPDAVAAVACNGMPLKLKFTVVAQANSPLLLTQPKGDPRMYVLEQDGRIRILRNGMLETKPFLDVALKNVIGKGERGLLGLAFHPDYMTNGRFFVHYTRRDNDPDSKGMQGDIVIAEGKRSDNPDVADSTLKAIATIEHPRGNHNGGMTTFGPDGMLYVGVGDGGGGGDPDKAGQNTKVKLGKILRFDVSKANYTPDAGNVPGGDPFVWAWGLRNPWRWSFDRETGDLYIGDVGQNEWEEVNFSPKNMGGKNYGWSTVEGTHCYGNQNCTKVGEVPVHEYQHQRNAAGNPQGSITGGYVYRGQNIPCLKGRYLYGDHNFSKIYSFMMVGGKATEHAELTSDLSVAPNTLAGLSSFGEDAAGELYVMSYDNNRIYRIDAE